ncbi:MAG TPA: efflux RND transporter periplasmic adaptor subunit, partial [Nitrobacter sp.]|nr:efflux RND transporter periplasmic adaptor subunit [Nitrobacter sp.]
MPRFNLRLTSVALLIAGLSPLLGGCDEPATAEASARAITPEVSVLTVVPKPHAMVRELPGRIAPMRVAEVRPRVSGIITKRLFEQGSEVKAGDSLYQIDPKPFAVELQAAEAALAKANAVFEQASHHARRIEKLTARHATSEAENEKAIAIMRQAEADVAGREADVARARLHLEYTTIRAPIDGVVGAAQVTEGALVV